ncbi:MAG: homocysteine S-methyltransferase family protein, partial [Gammaproteobacteria bacterium]|nr:homocysteine S-methyltransferase family protein [Gammaproteobacteria bacterium]NIV20259.1 homocysteine S-methyltransferase family protein [Gammaproteobacteria bacterium]
MKSTTISHLLRRPGPVLLDGGVGSELARRGIRTSMPLWSAHALFDHKGLQTLTKVHEDYARAGAEVLVANTFRTSRHTLRKAGREEHWRLVNGRAVECARAAAAIPTHPCLVAGAIAPLEDCYRPDLVPLQADCEDEHRRQVELLAELGVDLILIETMNCSREALAALVAARDCGIDALLSLCPRPPGHLLSGEPLDEA